MSRHENRAGEFRSRDKKVQKMTRDGLVEANLTTGQEQRVSQRTADICFDRARPEPGVPAKEGRGKSQRQRPKQSDMGIAEELEPVPTSAPMRDAGDRPMERTADADAPISSLPATEKQRPRDRGGGQSAPAPRPNQRAQYRPKSEEPPAAQEPEAVAEDAAKDLPENPRSRLQFEAPQPDREHGAAPPGAASASEKTGKAADGTARQKRRYEKAQRRVQSTGAKLEKAKEKLPQKRRLKLEKRYDSDSGKMKRHLLFEPEVIPQGDKGTLLKRVGKTALRGAGMEALHTGHQKLREVERQNVAVESAHKVETVGERLTGRVVRHLYRHHKSAPYQRVAKWEQKQAKAQISLSYQKALREHPELREKTVSRWIQRQKINRNYAKAAREAMKTAQHTRQAANTTGQVVRALAQFAGAHKTVFAIVVLLALVMVLFSSGLSSCTAMLSGIQSSIIASCYVADDKDINDAELFYTELETDLQQNINGTKSNFPDYDEYRFNIGEIGHNPYELMGYLSAAYDVFTFSQVQAELQRLFGLQYTLTRQEIIETRTYTDEDGDEHEYEWRVLQTTLAVCPLSQIIMESLRPGDPTDRYEVYMLTYGNRQAFSSPFSFPWLVYITSPYGYRIHPISGEKNLHRGVDIAVADGTPILAVQDGKVVSAGDAGDFGLCVVIEDDKGYQSRYAHCSRLSVRAGQEVKKGDIIAAVGSTGNSTGSHLHLEVTHNGEYLNPYYFVDTGTSGPVGEPGTPGGGEFPTNPGAPMGDKTFEAMLQEAEKYLGYPYVWGGSSPSTSFDCSGYVSWVINHSGWDVGHLGAQSLFNICTPVSKAEAQPGDLIFFTKTFSANTPVSHVGIYVGGGRMIHCGDPISYANINSKYWQEHFYSYGRLP